jgi:DNA-binding protein H-NS
MAQRNLASMSVDALLKLRDEIGVVLGRKAEELEGQLAKLSSDNSNGRVVKTKRGTSLKGRKVAAKYCSKKDPSLKWSGRGATPVWMREEMKGTKLKKENFLIK